MHQNFKERVIMDIGNNLSVNSANIQGIAPQAQVKEETPNLKIPNDSFESSSPKKPEKIGFFRLLFNRLTDEQIKAINETKTLPDGAKFMETLDAYGFPTGHPHLTWNAFGITPGTQTIPAGYELKNDILGFTHVVREGTQGLIYKK